MAPLVRRAARPQPGSPGARSKLKHNRLSITINQRALDVYEFLINPKNAPKWINSVKTETASEWPPKVGTIYRDHDVNGEIYEYEVSALAPGELVELSQEWGYHERITLTAQSPEVTQLHYHEWVDVGELPELTSHPRLERLKELIEG